MTSHSLVPAWNSFFVPDSFGWTFLDLVVKTTALIALASLLALLFARASAALRHRIWAMLFIAMFLLPVAGAVLPRWDWKVIPKCWDVAGHLSPGSQPDANPASLRPTLSSSPALQKVVGAAPTPVAPKIVEQSDLSSSVQGKVDDDAATLTRTESVDADTTFPVELPSAAFPWLAVAWFSGVCLALLPLAVGILGNIGCRFRWGSPVLSGDWDGLLVRLSKQVGLRRKVRLLLAGPQQMPMTFGMWRPCVVLPVDASGWSVERREIVLLHELSHIARHDVPLQMVARLACATYWFHPLAWWALRRMRIEREHACDDHVLRAGQSAPAYAAQLLEIARAHRGGSVLLDAALSMARPAQLEGRLLAVLDEHRSRRALGVISASCLATITVALVVTLSTVRVGVSATMPPRELVRQAETGSTAVPDPSSHPTVVTGVVLSPDGKPFPGARVEMVAYDRTYAWDRVRFRDEPLEYEHQETTSDARGAFRFILTRNVSQPSPTIALLASAGQYSPASRVNFQLIAPLNFELKLHEPKTIRVRFIDAAGAPVASVNARVGSALLKEQQRWSIAGSLRNSSAWPHCARSDNEGYTTVTVPVDAKEIILGIRDDRFGNTGVRVPATEKSAAAVLKKPQFVVGKVTADGAPVADAEVWLAGGLHQLSRTDSHGVFRIAADSGPGRPASRTQRSQLKVKPPTESDYLPQAVEFTWSDDFGDAHVAVTLHRGLIVEGRIVEKASGKGVKDATVYFESQLDNPYLRESDRRDYDRPAFRYLTKNDGRFRLPVLPGPGHVLVQGPSLDYLHTLFSRGERLYGKPGLDREYYDAAAKINFKLNEKPQSLTIPLTRGVTLRRRVVRPDGSPATGFAFTHSYLEFTPNIGFALVDVMIDDGLLELPGFNPAQTNPIIIADLNHDCAAIVSPSFSEIDVMSPPIRLQPCGSVRARFVNESGQPWAGPDPRLRLIVTPGPSSASSRPNQPLQGEFVLWGNLQWRNGSRLEKFRVDGDGKLTIHKLIPGATYQFEIGDHTWPDSERGFTIRPGETIDVGAVVVGK